MAFGDDKYDPTLGAAFRDPKFMAHLEENYQTTAPPKEVYPGDESVLRTLGFNEFNVSPNLDYRQRQGLSEQLQNAWRQSIGEDVETESQYQFQTPAEPGFRPSFPAEKDYTGAINQYMDPDPAKLAAESGVRTLPQTGDEIKFASASRDVQDKVYFVPDSTDKKRAIEKALRESEVYKDFPGRATYDWDVKMEPHRQQLMFRDPNHGGQYTYLNEPGLQGYDVKKELPKIGLMTGVAVTAALTMKRPILAAAVADVAVYTPMRYAELAKARKGGFLKYSETDESGKEITRDWTNREIGLQAAKEASFVFGISLATPMVINTMSRALRTIDPSNPAFQKVGNLPLDKDAILASRDFLKEVFTEASKKEGSEEAMKILSVMSAPEMIAYAERMGIKESADFGKLGTKRVPGGDYIGAGRMGDPGAIEGGAVQRQMVKFAQEETGPEAKIIRAALDRKQQLFNDLRKNRLNDDGFEELQELIIATEGDQATLGGLKILTGVETAKRPLIEAGKDALEEIEKNALKLGEEVAETGVPGTIVPTQIRGSIQTRRDKVFDGLDEQYANIYKRMKEETALNPNYFKIEIEPLVNYAANKLKKMDQSLFATLLDKEGGGSILKQLGKSREIIQKGTRSAYGKEADKVIGHKPSTIENYQADLKTIRRFKRQAYDQENYQLGSELNALEKEMMQLREDTMVKLAKPGVLIGENANKLYKDILKTDKAYKEAKELWDKGFIGNVLEKTKNSTNGGFGEYRLTDMAFLNKILNKNITDNEIEPLVDLVHKSQNADIQIMFANAIKGRYKELLDETPGAPLTPAQHKSFMRTNKVAIERFLTKDQKSLFKNAQKASIAIKDDKLKQQAILESIRKTPWGTELVEDVVESEPQRIFHKMWKIGGENDMFNANKELVKILKSNGQVGKDAIKSFKAQIMRDMEDRTGLFSTKDTGLSVAKELDDYLGKYKPLLDVWYGENFTRSMKTLQRMATFFETLPAKGPRAGERSFYQGVFSNLARVIVGMFTREGRALTAVQVIGSKFATKRIFKDLIEGDKLATRLEATKWMRDPKNLEAIRRLLVLGELYTGRPSIIGEPAPKSNMPVGEGLDIEEAAMIPPIIRGSELGRYDTYESYNVGGRVKRSKLMKLKYGL
tara:strand:- start:426 stop:3845 length:3420 start_codon:yes stop_codon:yes gene_type:complete